MKGRNREINIFSMSALDLFASALGAFILIAVVLFPYFPNTGNSPEDIARLRQALTDSQQQLQQCQAQLQQTQADLAQAQSELAQARSALAETQQQLEQCTQELRKKFLLIIISWSTRDDDVDLHVIDPEGREFYYQKKSHPGTPAKLEEDNERGPGNEVWLHPRATPGDYKVYYNLYANRQQQSPVPVRGAMLTPEGRTELPGVTLSRVRQKQPVAIITVDNQGNARMRRM